MEGGGRGGINLELYYNFSYRLACRNLHAVVSQSVAVTAITSVTG